MIFYHRYKLSDHLLSFVLAVVSLCLNATLPLQAQADAGLDDKLFVQLAESLCSGGWLGDYGLATLSKGMALPAFICASSLIGLPLRLSQQLLFLLAGFVAGRTIAEHAPYKAIFHIIFALFAFFPVVWCYDYVAVVRENLYLSVSVLVFVAGMAAFDPRWPGLRARMPFLVALGLTFGVYYLTREEDVWLYPALLTFVAFRGYGIFRRLRTSAASSGAFAPVAVREGLGIGIAILAAAATIVPVWMLNDAYYGVFRDNDFRSQPFRDAYGAIARIEHDEWHRYVVWPKDARERAYAVSPAARELAPHFEGEKIRQDMWPGWTEIDSSHFIWSLREAAARAGHFTSASAADAYFRQLTREIDEACDSGRLACHPRRSGFQPVLRPHFLTDAFAAAFDPDYHPPYLPDAAGLPGFVYRLIGLQFGPIRVAANSGDDYSRAMFARMTVSAVPPSALPGPFQRLAGWAYVPDTAIAVSVEPDTEPDGDGAVAAFAVRPADDVAKALGPAARYAVRFNGRLACRSCTLAIRYGDTVQTIAIAGPGAAGTGSGHVFFEVLEPEPPAPPPLVPGFAWRFAWMENIAAVYRNAFIVLTVLGA
jgi:hypothetical protein